MKNYFMLVLLPIVLSSLGGCSKVDDKPKFDGDLALGAFPQSEAGESAPIGWDIIYQPPGSRHDKEALVISHYILAPMAFDTGGDWNYKESSIRKWLNGDFYNNAFTEDEKAKIHTSDVDNSADSTSDSTNQYVCEDTKDKVFLLSYMEATTAYKSDEERKAYATNYAVKQGLECRENTNNSSDWWLRSADPEQPIRGRFVIKVFDNGKLHNADGSVTSGNVSNATKYGVRPAMWISLE